MKFTVPFNPVSAARPNWSAKSGQATKTYMPHKYAQFRREAGIWFENWLAKTDYALVHELAHLPDGRSIRDSKTGRLSYDFKGYKITLVFYVETPNSELRPFPLTTQSSDLDNYYKGITDMVFESDTFKNVAQLNDRWIHMCTMGKMACPKGEGRTVVDLSMLNA